ncbi:MAG: hypothetical protein IT371_02400 [Deltaproteobacteria bacterium]|nr:hypothetical protein [Deltaproteobacteria bacterium]
MARPSLLLVSAALLALVGQAHANPTPSDLELAKKHFELGRIYYDQAAYDRALTEFKEAYRLSKKPALLYNIGKCHESLGQLKDAITQYEKYLAETGQEDANLKARVANLRSRLEAQEKASPKAGPTPRPQPEPTPPKADPTAGPTPDPSAPVPSTPGQPEAPPSGPAERPSRWMWWTGWALAGAGVALVGTGIGLGLASKSKASTVEDAYRIGRYEWSAIQPIEQDGKRLQSAMIGTVIVGALAAAGGVTLLLLSPRATSRSVSLAPLLGPDAFGVASSLSF